MKIFITSSLLRPGLFALVCLFMGCGSGSADNPDPPHVYPAPAFPALVIKRGEENGHPAGIRLAIQRTMGTQRTTAYTLISSYGGKPVGLIIGVPGTDGKGSSGRAFMKSLGAPSDLFLKVLAAEYDQPLDSAARFTDSIPFDCMNLHAFYDANGDSTEKDRWIAAEYKLFFDAESVSGDAELFMNINPALRWVEFAEKDKDYRPHLIKLFMRRQ